MVKSDLEAGAAEAGRRDKGYYKELGMFADAPRRASIPAMVAARQAWFLGGCVCFVVLPP